jgi:thiol-disulfide isomerase/thioredoxin
MLSTFDRAHVWLNGEPQLDGRVVAVDFWTYSCVNWLRTLPYVRAWHERYAEAGLVVVGVHAPEFSFEHELANVQRAVSDLDVRYPVVIDNDFSIWRAFDNHYWPALYVLDRDGRVGFQHFGEEAYAESERAIQTLLGLDEPLSDVDASGVAAPADWAALNSPETYLGSLRGERRGRTGLLTRNQWALSGDWTVAEEFSALDAAGGSIAYRFEGRDVNLVLGADAPVGFTVTVDGEPPGAVAGIDVDRAGAGVVAEPRMYQLVRQQAAVAERDFEITFLDAGARAYVFTFG